MKKQQELERHMEKQRQIEKQKEEQRQKMMEQREVGLILQTGRLEMFYDFIVCTFYLP